MLKVICNKAGIQEASQIIARGGIAVFPTDTVYGIGCNPYSRESVRKIYEIKSRDTSKPLPVLVYSREVAERIAFFDGLAKKIAEKFWPGPLTIILKLKDQKLKESLNLDDDKIAVRVPDHDCMRELLKRCDFLVGTSANVSGESSFTDPDKCSDALQGYDIFLDGGTIASKAESTIIEIEDEKVRVIREGPLDIKEILGE